MDRRGGEDEADELLLPGVVFAGDAAGWSDPIIGQRLSVAFAMRES
jgi:hypothetical protein